MENMKVVLMNEVQEFVNTRNTIIAENFLKDFIRLVNLEDFQLDVLKDFTSWFKIFSFASESFLKSFPMLFPKLEKFLIEKLIYTNVVVQNFSLFLLLDISQIIPVQRLDQICEYLIDYCQSTSTPPDHIFRFLSNNSSLLFTLQHLLKHKLFDLLTKTAFYISPNREIFEFTKSQIGVNPSIPLHYLLTKSADNQNLSSHFKSCASRIWTSNPNSKKSKIEVLVLIEYSLCKFIAFEVHNIDIVKSIIVTLNVIQVYIQQEKDHEVGVRVLALLDRISELKFLEQHQRKVNDLVEKIRGMVRDDATKWNGDCGKVIEMCRGNLDIYGPISVLRERLGMDGKVGNSYREAADALEEVIQRLKGVNEPSCN